MLFGEVTEEPVTVTQAELQALPREQQIALIASLPEAQQEELIDATFSPLLRIGVKAEIAKKAAGTPTRVAYEEEVWEEELEPDLAADLDNIKMKHAAAFGGGRGGATSTSTSTSIEICNGVKRTITTTTRTYPDGSTETTTETMEETA